MKNCLIIEDEIIAAQHLRKTLQEVDPDYNVTGVLQSIEEAVEYFRLSPMPDLCFMDINLADGLSLRIFDSVEVTCPVIFTTAYEQYALDAFKVNSIDYLLKPISPDGLRRALGKLEALRGSQGEMPALGKANLQGLINTLRDEGGSQYKSSFLIPVLDKLVPLPVRDIACIYIEDKISHALLTNGQEQCIDKPLDTLLEQLDPRRFFRANRQYIIAHSAIKEISIWPISKLAITLVVDTPERIIISKARVPEFKEWYTK